MAREDNKQVGPKKETGLRHPLGEPLDLTPQQRRRIEKMLDPVKSSKSTSDKVKEKIVKTGKKLLEFTPPGQVKKFVDFVKDKTKKKTGIDVNKGDNQKNFKVNTGNNNSSAGSSNPRRAGAKFGGRMGYKNGSKGGRAMLRGGGICKKGMNKKAVGKNS